MAVHWGGRGPGHLSRNTFPNSALNIYVDSVAGSDSNSGLTEGAALQTLSAAQTRASAESGPVRVNLARGSTWRERFDIPKNDVLIAVYGSGDMPVIDGADVVTTGWTQPNAGLYPNVWSRSWSRASATTTASEMLGYWEAGVRTTRRADLAALQAGSNGDWHTTSLTNQTSTVSIRAAADPNSDGILREITKRHYAINGHAQIIGASRTGCTITGPIEMKRCVGHYNALSGPKDGTSRQLWLRDGNIHHTVTEGLLTEDVLATEYSPDIGPSVFTAFRTDGSVFDHTFRRCLAITPGGASRYQSTSASAFYAHASTGTAAARNIVIEGSLSRGLVFGNAASETFTVRGCYSEDPFGIHYGASSSANTFECCIARDTTSTGAAASNRAAIRRLTNATFTPDLEVTNCALILNGGGVTVQIGNTYPATLTNSLIYNASSNPIRGVPGDRCSPTVNNCILWGARSYDDFQTGYVGDYNVFYFIGQDAPQFSMNGTVYGGADMTAWQAASGQDANSVFLKPADQTAGNAHAFWLGVAQNINTGPYDGDFRINPNAYVYNGAGTRLTGTFADGTTPITAAGPQAYWDFNQRAVVSGVIPGFPTEPTSATDARTYIENPAAWDFYP